MSRASCVRRRSSCSLAGCPAVAWAGHGKVDHVVLKTGDRFTCKIVRLVRGKLTVKTDALGTWSNGTRSVAWTARRSTRSRSNRAPAGLASSPRRPMGSSPSARARSHSRRPSKRSSSSRRSSGASGTGSTESISAGFSYTQASELTQWSLHADANQRTRNWLTQATFDSMLTIESADDQGESRQTLTPSVEPVSPTAGSGRFSASSPETKISGWSTAPSQAAASAASWSTPRPRPFQPRPG